MRPAPSLVLLLVLATVSAGCLAGVGPNLSAQSAGTAAASPEAANASSTAPGGLSFRAPIALGGTSQFRMQATCQDVQCGGGEPVVTVSPDGDIYVSATCCVGAGPPVWVSRNDGASFVQLVGGPAKDVGVEGSLATDTAGNVYFSDTSVASLYLTSWTGNGTYRYTVPACPCQPIVDRPWIEAGAPGVLYFLYNTGSSSDFLRSTDGGLTWVQTMSFPAPLGNIGQGPARTDLWVVANLTLYESTDGGLTWSAGTPVPTPSAWGSPFQAFSVPVADAAGNAWVVYDWAPKGGSGATAIYAARLDPSGHWHGPFLVSPAAGTYAMPWAAAGPDGSLAVAWYGAPNASASPDGVSNTTAWYLYAALTLNGTADHPAFQVVRADPTPVLHGPLGRNLWDFLQVAIHPHGQVVVAYADRHHHRGYPLTDVVVSHPVAGLAAASGSS